MTLPLPDASRYSSEQDLNTAAVVQVMWKLDRQSDLGIKKAEEAGLDPGVKQLLDVCGFERFDLVADVALQVICTRDEKLDFLTIKQLNEQVWSLNHLWRRPLETALQSRYADCRCSPFGRLVMRNTVVSGSTAEGLYDPVQPQKIFTDMDKMTEMGPVCWKFPGTQKASPVENTESKPATTADQDSGLAPRLVIEETKNAGFVLVLQERRDDCTHQERRPFRAQAVAQFFIDCELMASGENITNRSTNRPASSTDRPVNEAYGLSEFDNMPCLHVPVWWFSDEFFIRHRKYKWPPKNMLDDIREYGLHLMPVAAPGSSKEKLQWHMSFSRAEVVIASRLTNLQRCAAITFNICKTTLGEDSIVVKPYFVMTALFWLCEQTPAEHWTSVTQGVLKLVDFLEHAVSTGNLPCFFWSRINLLRFASRADRKAMTKMLGTIRQYYRALLAYEVCAHFPELQKMLTHEVKRLSERQLRVRLTRWLVVMGVFNSIRAYMQLHTTHSVDELLPVLVRTYTPDEAMRLFRLCSLFYRLQTLLFRALTVAPEDVASHVQFSASDDGFVWDAAPLLELLTEDDLEVVLVDPDAVRSWLRRHHQLPEAERPACTLPADLRTPREQQVCDLLLNTPLLMWTIKESVPAKWEALSTLAVGSPLELVKPRGISVEKAREGTRLLSPRWREVTNLLHTRLGMDQQTAQETACRVGLQQLGLCEDPETRAEHMRICGTLPDAWQLKHFIYGASP